MSEVDLPVLSWDVSLQLMGGLPGMESSLCRGGCTDGTLFVYRLMTDLMVGKKKRGCRKRYRASGPMCRVLWMPVMISWGCREGRAMRLFRVIHPCGVVSPPFSCSLVSFSAEYLGAREGVI